MQFSSDGRVTAVFFAHPASLAISSGLSRHPVIGLHNKSNKHGMPLLDMIGRRLPVIFCIAFAFLSGETEKDYLWALTRLKSLYGVCSAELPSVILANRCIPCMNAVSTCFPSAASLLCLLHANKAVLRYYQPAFTRPRQGSEA